METSIRRIIIENYETAGFWMQETQHSQSLRFSNQFSVHFVFLFDSLGELKDEWKTRHDLLTEDYLRYIGPRDLEWNYYGIFSVDMQDEVENTEFEHMRTIIEANTSYSRKFVVRTSDNDQLPPGRVDIGDRSDVHLDPAVPIILWEKILGEQLFEAIVEGPKNSIGARLRDLIVEESK